MLDKLKALWAKAKTLAKKAGVLVRAVPAWAAAATATLTAASIAVVPLLPGPTGVHVAADIAAVIAAIKAVAAAVARVTPVPADERGLLPAGDER